MKESGSPPIHPEIISHREIMSSRVSIRDFSEACESAYLAVEKTDLARRIKNSLEFVKEKNFVGYILRLGSKQLFVKILRNVGKIETDVIEVPSQRDQKETGETTKLYRQALEYMQLQADTDKKTYSYVLRTSVPTMIRWAKTTGDEIFTWEQVEAFLTSTLAEIEIDNVDKFIEDGSKVQVNFFRKFNPTSIESS